MTETDLADTDFRSLAENLPTLCWTANADGWITWYNRRWYEFTGTTPADMEGWGWQTVHHPDRLPDVLTRWQASIATGERFEMTFPLRAADGTYRPFLTRVDPMRDGLGRITSWFGVNTDILDQVEAEAALRVERDRSHGILENIREGFLLLDAGFRIRQINAEGLRMDGRHASEIVGRSHWDAYPGTEQGVIGGLYSSALRDGVPVALDHRYTWPDGHHAWVEMRAYPAPDRASLAIFYRDVTQRKEAEEALRESEERFRVFAQAMPNQIWAASADGLIDWFNDQVFAYSGARLDDLRGSAWTSIVHPDDVERAGHAWTEALASRTVYETEFRIRRFDGTYRWFLVRGEPIWAADGGVSQWVGSNTDVDDQKRTAAELVALNAALEQRVEERTRERDRAWRLSQDLLVVIDVDGVVRSVNAAWTNLLGWKEDELVGIILPLLIHPDDLTTSLEVLGGIVDAPLTEPYESRLRHKDGSHRWFAWTAAFEDGTVYASGRHATFEKEKSAALGAAEEGLRQAQKMEAVGQLTGGVAHDFNNLLTVIRSSIDLMRRPDLAEERRRRYMDAISDTVTRAAKLTGQLLAFARRQALQPEVFDAAKGVGAIGDMLGTLTGSRIAVDLTVPDTPCLIDADPSQFDTAIVNMAVNARDAMDGEGRLTIVVGCAVGIPAYGAQPAASGDFVSVSVSDTGTGIAEADLARIFEPFFTTKGVGEGTGLGLSQVFGFAKQSGGEVRVESEVGCGTTFTLYLPHASTAKPVEPQAEPEPVADGHGTCVLVVEDNRDVGTFATQALEDLGYVTVWAANAKEALSELERDAERFDVVFSDVVMPGMGGVDLAQEVRRLHHDLPVILTSGYSHVLAQNGTYGFELLHKPYSVEQLSRILRKAATWQRRRRILGA